MKPRPAGIAIGLVGNLMLGVGLYHIMGVGSCGGVHPPCPSSSSLFFALVPIGMIVSIGSMFAGGFIIFGTTFATVGVASIVRGFNGGVGPEQDTTFAFAFGGVFLLPVLLPFLFMPFKRRSRREAQRLAAEGRKATATVTAVNDTGVTINDNPRVELVLSIQPDDGGAAFEGTKKLTVSRVQVPRAGDRYPVLYDPADPSKFQMGEIAQAAPPAPAGPPAAAPSPSPSPSPETEWVTELGRLNELRMSGALTDEEFTRAKDRLLAGSPPGPAGG